jgi:4-amino-4-deoxy-L-arabinose transferase-like glycosyltransferase
VRSLRRQTRTEAATADTPERRRVRLSHFALLVMLVVAFAIRLDGITGPPFDNAVARQFHAALLARMYYLNDSSHVAPEKRAVVTAWHDEVEPIEPPVMEHLAALTYRLAGHEELWLARLLSVLWWTGGGALLYLIALRVVQPAAALATCAVFLFLPFAVLASRSFQPDPLLIGAMLAAILAVLRYEEKPSGGRLGLAAAVLALAFLIKPGIVPPILGPLLLVLLLRRRRHGAHVLRDLGVFVLSLVPMFAWYAYGTLAHSFLRGHFRAKVRPSLLLESSFWNGWWDQVVFVLTYPLKSGPLALLVLLAAAAGVAVAKRGRPRTLLIVLWAGYVLYGLVFTIHISTHNYYSLPLVPIVALSLGSTVDAFARWSRATELQAAALVTAAALLAAGAVGWKLHGPLTDPSFRAEEAVYAAAGRAADHTPQALYVDTHYAEPARYYGWTAGTLLTSGYERDPEGLARRTLATTLREMPSPSCLIFTGSGLRRRLAGFEAQVAKRFSVRREAADFAVYDLSTPAGERSDGC